MKKSILKTSMTVRDNYIDIETGELIESNEKKHTYLANTKEEFFLLYVNVLPIFIKLSGPSKSVYAYILHNYRGNVPFEIGKGMRRLIADYCGLSMSSVANALTQLKDEKLVYSKSVGIYQINPRYAFKGSSSDRHQALQAVIKLGCREC